ncbi:MAG: ABC transporter substrate-binding protein [Deltaproteobacteria bacterium]|nr:MAG: ABC transporter substrate-binding protein [Deltaproteobacteria bacterium]
MDHSPTEINPLTTDSSISANLINLIFDPLFICSENGQLIPNIIKKWEILSEGLVWKLELRKDVFFHDQYRLKTSDIKFTYDYLRLKLSRGHSHYLDSVKDIVVDDDDHVSIFLKKADNDFLTALCEFGIAPQHLLEKTSDFSKFNSLPIGSGPYRFVSQSSDSIVLKKNENYFSKFDSLDRIDVKVYKDQKSVLNHLIAGDVEMTFLTNPEDYGALEKIPSIKVYDNWYPRLYLLGFNNSHHLFSEPDIRKALNFAINKQSLIKSVAMNKVFLPRGTLRPDSQEYESYAGNDGIAYNPKEALKILKKNGWSDRNGDFILDKKGKPFEFSTVTFDGENLALQTLKNIQTQLRDVGVLMKIETLPLDQYINRVMRKSDFDAYIINLVSRPYYNNDFVFWHSSQIKDGMNFSHYQNKKVDQLLEEMRSEVDERKRNEMNVNLQNELIASPPGVFLFWRKMPIAVNTRFTGVPEKRMQNLRDLIYFKPAH